MQSCHIVQAIEFSDLILSDHQVHSLQSTNLFYGAIPHCLTLQKVVKVSAIEEGHWHSEHFMGCTVCVKEELVTVIKVSLLASVN